MRLPRPALRQRSGVQQVQIGSRAQKAGNDLGRVVDRAVVDDDDVVERARIALVEQSTQASADVVAFVARGDDERHVRQRTHLGRGRLERRKRTVLPEGANEQQTDESGPKDGNQDVEHGLLVPMTKALALFRAKMLTLLEV